MITFEAVTRRYGDTVAVDGLSVTVAAGRVTGLLGPNGAGKSTSLRLLLGLHHASSGRVLVDGRPYREHKHPLRLVGAHLDSGSVHPGRSARQHLLALARAGRLPERRVDACLELVGLAGVAGTRAGQFSLGMTQRLGLAGALLGDPQVLVLDEPVNGLDTDGVRWVRELLRGFAAEGRTVLISSHLLAEVEQTVDQVVVLGRGRLLADRPVEHLLHAATGPTLLLTPDPGAATTLAAALPGVRVDTDPARPGQVVVHGRSPAEVGDAAWSLGLRVHGLTPERTTLEDAYRQLVDGSVEHVAGRPGPRRVA